MRFSIVLFSWEIPILGLHNPVRRFGSKTIRESGIIFLGLPKGSRWLPQPKTLRVCPGRLEGPQVLGVRQPSVGPPRLGLQNS